MAESSALYSQGEPVLDKHVVTISKPSLRVKCDAIEECIRGIWALHDYETMAENSQQSLACNSTAHLPPPWPCWAYGDGAR